VIRRRLIKKPFPESPRSGRQRKAWGVSPRIASGKGNKACESGRQPHILN